MKIAKGHPVGKVECIGLPLATPDGWVAIDTEGTGLDPWGTRGLDRPHWPARPFAFSLCNADGETSWVRWQVDARTRRPIVDRASFDLLQELLGDASVLKVFHNRSYDLRMLQLTGFTVAGEFHDTLIGMHVINPDEMTYALKPLSKKYLDFPDDDESELHESTALARKRVQLARRSDPTSDLAKICIADKEWFGDEPARADYWIADPAIVRRYGVGDAERTARLYLAQLQALDEDEANGGKLWCVLRREFALADVIAKMENRGTTLDVPRTEELKKFYDDYVAMCRIKIDEHGGTGLNPKSPKQMCEMFFGKLGMIPKDYSFRDDKSPTPCPHCAGVLLDENGLPTVRLKTTKSGKTIKQKVKESPGCKVCQFTGQSPKCDASYLVSIREKTPLAKWMVEYDAAMHMLSSFVTTYMQVKTRGDHGSWVIHPNYKQCGPITGRMSCERPNMMNVAADTSGHKKCEIPYRVRECFIPRPGHVLYLPDYSQIEVWVFAFLSGDPTLQAPLLAGLDYHGVIAQQIWGHLWNKEEVEILKHKKPEELTKAESELLRMVKKCRGRSKLIQFCKLYGGGTARVAELLGVSLEEAETFVRDYDARLPGVKTFMKKMVDRARRDGHILNPFGRRYPVQRDYAYRAVNYLVQGSSAELMKNALVRVSNFCELPEWRGRVHVLLTIHDEIVVEATTEAHSPRLMRGVVEAMQGNDHRIIGSPKPFPVGMKIATERWALTQEIKDLTDAN